MSQPIGRSTVVKPFEALYEFVKSHLLIVNAVVLFGTFVVAVLGFLFPPIKPLLVLVYWFTGSLSVLMIFAAFFPITWSRVIRRFNFGQVDGDFSAVPLHQRPAWRGATVLFVGITLAGIVTLAKANLGEKIVDTFPELKEMQATLILLFKKVIVVGQGVDDANAKLDRIAEAVDPNNPADRCPDLGCALIDGASRKTLEKFWAKGERFPSSNVLLADLMKRVMLSKSPVRQDTINFLMDHDFPSDIKISPAVLDQADLPKDGANLMAQAWQVADLGRNPTTKFTRVVQGDQTMNAWNDMAGCIVRTSGGLTPIQLAALTGDDVLFSLFVKRGLKMPAEPVSCKWKAGMDIPRPGHPGEFMARAMTGQVAIQIDGKGQASVLAQR